MYLYICIGLQTSNNNDNDFLLYTHVCPCLSLPFFLFLFILLGCLSLLLKLSPILNIKLQMDQALSQSGRVQYIIPT